MMMLMLDARVTSMNTRKSSSRIDGLLVRIGTAARIAMSPTTSGRNGNRYRLTSAVLAGGTASCARPQEAGGPHEQDQDEDRVLEDRHPRDRDEHGGDSLQEAEHDAAQERTGGVPQPAEHDDDKALHLVGPAGERREREERRQEPAAHHRERRADAEGERQHSPRVDAHELRGAAVIGHGADRLPDARPEEEAVETGRDDDRRDHRHGVRAQDRDIPRADRAKRHVHRAWRGGEDACRDADDHQVDRERREERRELGRVDHPVDGQKVFDDAEDEAEQQGRDDPEVRVDAEVREKHVHDEHAEGDDRPMGQVDDTHHTEDEREAEGRKAVDEAEHETVNRRRDEGVEAHARLVLPIRLWAYLRRTASADLASAGHTICVASLPSDPLSHCTYTMSCAVCLPWVFASVENLMWPKNVMRSSLSSAARTLAASVEPASSSAFWSTSPAAKI